MSEVAGSSRSSAALCLSARRAPASGALAASGAPHRCGQGGGLALFSGPPRRFALPSPRAPSSTFE
eukprot:2489134-Alexandrium_andersonii.AAC.1